jgi:cytidylate kinase
MRTQTARGLAPVVAIDGGSATGKGTTRKLVAEALLGFHQLDSGVLYRATGLLCKEKGIVRSSECGQVARTLNIMFEGDTVFLDGVDVTRRLRTNECGQLASTVARMQEVRDGLLDFQLKARKWPGLVADGRDQGLIFAGSCRFFLTTDPEERARRKVKESTALGQPIDFDTALHDIQTRDARDRSCSIVPLKPHPEAMVIDTTNKTPTEVVFLILQRYQQACT